VLSADRIKYEDQIAAFFLEEVFGQTGLYAVDNVWPVGPNIKPWGDFVKQGDLRQVNKSINRTAATNKKRTNLRVGPLFIFHSICQTVIRVVRIAITGKRGVSELRR